jgi:hypothetical protein
LVCNLFCQILLLFCTFNLLGKTFSILLLQTNICLSEMYSF